MKEFKDLKVDDEAYVATYQNIEKNNDYMSLKKLTPKQKIFCDEYLISRNATQAAIKAGYSEKSAKVIGMENLTKPYIKEYVDAELAKTSQKLEITRETQLKRLENLFSQSETIKEGVLVIQEQNKLLGLYSPEVKINRNIDSDKQLDPNEEELINDLTNELYSKKVTSK